METEKRAYRVALGLVPMQMLSGEKEPKSTVQQDAPTILEINVQSCNRWKLSISISGTKQSCHGVR